MKNNKKKVLFVTDSLSCDGASRSLLSLLSIIEYDRYDVECLFLFKNNFFMDELPNKVRKIEPDDITKAFFSSLLKSIFLLLKKGCVHLIIYRIAIAISIRLDLKLFQRIWIRAVQKLPVLQYVFDVVIGYQDIWAGYYAAFRTKARIKIGWNHHDYIAMKRDRFADSIYIKHINYLITVSKSSRESLLKALPEFKNKFIVIPNIILSEHVECKSIEEHGFEDNFNGKRILTIGRVCKEKGIDIAFKVCLKLIKEGYNIRWYIIGDGPLKTKLMRLARKEKIEDRFILMGNKKNPYPYLKQTDIYVQPSRTEAYGISVCEAKILKKAIVVTDLPALKELIENGNNGLVVRQCVEDIYIGIKRLLDEPYLNEFLSKNLSNYKLDNSEIRILNELLNK